MECSTRRIATVQILNRMIWNRWRTVEFEWNISQDVLHWKSSRRSKKICKIKTFEPAF